MNGLGRRRFALHGLFAFVDERLDVGRLHAPSPADLKAAQLPADQQAAGRELLDRFAQRGAGDAELFGQLPLRGQPLPRLEAALEDHGLETFGDDVGETGLADGLVGHGRRLRDDRAYLL